MDTQTFDLKYWSGLGFTLIVGYTISLLIWRHYFSPLASIPGPFWASVTRLWHAYHIFEGDHNTEILQLHEQHGHFVRIAPNEISVSHPDGPKLILQTLLRKVRGGESVKFTLTPNTSSHSVGVIGQAQRCTLHHLRIATTMKSTYLSSSLSLVIDV